MANSFELDYQKYADFLKDEVQFRYIIAVILAILFLGFVVLILSGFMVSTKKEMSFRSKIVCILLCFCLFSFLFCFLIKEIYLMKTDIESNAYVVYEGGFDYKEEGFYKGGKSYLVTFTVDGKEITVVAQGLNINDGSYTGRLVYAKNSERLLDYTIYENSESLEKTID